MKRYVTFGCMLYGLLAGTGTVHAQQDAHRSDTAAVSAPVVLPGGRTAAAGPQGVAQVRRRIAQLRGAGAPSPQVVYPIVVQTAPSAAPAAPATEPVEGLTRSDLDRLERYLLRRLDQRFQDLDGLIRTRGGGSPQLIVLPEGADRDLLQALLDSLRTAEQAAPPSASSPAELPPAEVRLPFREPATVEQVERAILETGLFQAVNVNFEFDRSVLLPASRSTLDAVGAVLVQYPELRIRVGGHTDSIGPAAYNERLSQARAEAVRSYLIDTFSIDPSRLEAQGFGEARPVARNTTPTGRTLNRRVEFRVLNPEAAERYRRTTTPQEENQAQQDLREAIRDVLREELQRDQAP